MTARWTAPDIAGLRGDNTRPLQKIFASLTEYLQGLVENTRVLQTYVRNAEATTLEIGEVVYLDQRQGDRATVKRALNTSDATSAKTLGVVAERIAPNADGLVTTQGYVYNMNLSAFTAGQTVYLSNVAGGITATKPVAPNHLVYVGVVVRANAGNGILYARAQNGYELDEIHDVLISSPTQGQVLSYNASTSLWQNSTFSDGGGLTNLNASNLASGTVPSARVSGSYTGITGVGTITTGTWSGSFGAVSGANLTSLNASNLSSGTVPSARISGSYTGITGIGTLAQNLIVDGPNTPQVRIGDWTANSFYTAIEASGYGYILLGSATDINTYVRSLSGVVYIGTPTSNTLAVGGSSVTSTANVSAPNYLASGNNYFVTNTTSTASSTDSGNLGYTGAVADTAMPWCTGPALGGRTGWAFYSWAAGGYRMGFRGTTNNAARYFWCADWAYFGSQPNDARVVSGVTVEGDVRTYSSFIATNYLVSTASPTGSGNAAQWLAAFGQYYLVRNTSTRAEKENFQSVGQWLTPNMLDRIDVQMWNRTNAPNVPEIGPIAEDMEAISPFLGVRGMDFDENGEVVVTPVQGINQNSWISLITIALQETRKRLTELEEKVHATATTD